MNATLEPPKVHPFLEAGLGDGPYAYVGNYDLGEAMNPDSAANFGSMRGFLSDAPKLKGELGTCSCCGMAIMNICIIRNGAGELYGVGTDCVEKAGDGGMVKMAQAASALRQKAKAQKRAAAKRAEKWEREAPEREARAKAYAEAQAKAEDERKVREAGLLVKLAPVMHILTALEQYPTNEFYASLASQLRSFGSISPNQARYALRCYYGNRILKADTEAADQDFDNLTTPPTVDP